MQNGSVGRVQKPMVSHWGLEVPGNHAKRFRGNDAKLLVFIGFLRYLELCKMIGFPGGSVKRGAKTIGFHKVLRYLGTTQNQRVQKLLVFMWL